MAIVRWDPFRDFGFVAANSWVPPVDIYQNGDLVVRLPLREESKPRSIKVDVAA
jgi:hypothetical protein